MGEIDGAGEIVTGALLGRAAEPAAGEDGGHGEICLNCGTALIGAHCYRCGQAAHVHRSLGGIGHDLLHGVLHFEGKLWRTLPLLVWQPGELTRRYIAGERARFVSPIALFLFSIFTLFAVFSLFAVTPHFDGADAISRAQTNTARAQLAAERQEVAGRGPSASSDARARALDRIDAEIAALDSGEASANPPKLDVNIGWAPLDHGVQKALKNPSLALYKLQSNSYKFSWLLIPLSLPFLWLLFAWRREFHLYDHAVFVTYSIAFMSLLFIAITLAGAIGVSGALLNWIGVLAVPLHLFRQLKGAYGLSRVGAVLRTLILLFFALIVLLLFGLLLILIGFSG